MAISTYAELQSAIASWLHRTDLTAVIPDFIDLCEASMQRNLKVGDQETTATLSLTSSGTVALPTGYNGARRLRYFDGSVYQDISFVDLVPSDYDGVTASRPVVAVVVGSNLTIRPIPDQTYTATLDYYAKFTPLSTTDTSNWILTSHPDAYLYGTLLQSAPYVGTDVRFPVWSDGYKTAIDEIEYDDYQRRFSQNKMRSDAIGMTSPPMWNINTGQTW
jgi:hypothetical protein